MSFLDRPRSSLRGRLAFNLVVGLVVVMGISFFGLHLLIRQEIYRHIDNDLLLRMRAVAAYAVAHPGKESIAEFMPRFRTRTHQDFFQIWDGAGRVLARSDSSAGKDLPRLGSVVGTPTYYDLTLPDGHAGRAIAEAFALEAGDSRGRLEVVTTEETESLESLETRIHMSLLMVALATLFAVLVIARLSVVAGLRPLDDLANSLARVDLDDPNARLDTGPLPTELQSFASSFSALLDRLLAGIAREKRYARNVAHELRNPLAEMRLLTDVGVSQQDSEVLRAVLRDIGAAAAEMEQIVDSLMALTRYEAGLEVPQPEPVDLAAKLRKQVDGISAGAGRKALTIEVELPGEVWVHTDIALLRRLLSNLFNNAMAHAPAGSTVTVKLDPRGEIQLANQAPHLSAADVPRLGERFFRVGAGDGGTHAGLGLSLAGAIARVLGLRLDLRLDDDGHLVATISGFKPLA
ncbi:MAG: hypothetical protein FIB04_09840 [Gammaproteobacteria bacterium]|nr:hypothetical protein [Gammaproteobacteria bacterium]